MPDLAPADLHVLQPLKVKAKRHSFAADEDDNFKRIQRARKRPTAKSTRDIPWFDGTTGVPDMQTTKASRMIQKRFHSASNRRKAAKSNDALPDGSYPITGPADLGPAATLARSGHGNVAAAKRLIARQAKKFGVKNPLATDGVSKSLEQYRDGPVPLISYLEKFNR